MTLKRRDFISLTGVTAASGLIAGFSSCSADRRKATAGSSTALESMVGDVTPIALSEREERIAKAQRLLAENRLDALILEAGTGLNYFTGISWWPSERTMVAVIPAKGDVKYVCPAFEEARFREQISIGKDVYAWQEDESPYRLISTVFKDIGIVSGNIAIEEETRFFIANGIQQEAPHLNYVSGDTVTIPCRIIKSTAEIRLMQKANDITLSAIKYGVSRLKEGMSQDELSSIIMSAQRELGGMPDFALCLFGKASAFPHGTREPQRLK
ncbi:MAG TPA: aminopeptidase P family N-terminal domain-containing protein, partial [Puia sp.]|nr:aminopeptidase P family N-terminal domain-containing protein [Puia sp.]